ncbi:MAG: hypothetical protein Q9205_003839 [Flavoplaca limonia]
MQHDLITCGHAVFNLVFKFIERPRFLISTVQAFETEYQELKRFLFSDDNVDDSDTLFVPTGKSTSKSKSKIARKSPGTNKPSKGLKKGQKGQKGQLDAIDKSLASSAILRTPKDKPTVTTKPIPDKTPTKPSQVAKDSRATSATTSRSAIMPKTAGNILETLGSFPGELPLEDDLRIDDDTQKKQNLDDLMSAQVDIAKIKSKPKSLPTRKPRADQDKQVDHIIAAFDFPTARDQWNNGQTRFPAHLQAVSHQKVPTELQYIGGGAFKWGFQIPHGVERCKWFKLLLDPESSRIKVGQALAVAYDTQAAPPGYDQEPEELVRDYLTALREHFKAVLAKELPSITASTSIKYVLTVPAVWSNEAIIKTRRCAKQAGMGSPPIITAVADTPMFL